MFNSPRVISHIEQPVHYTIFDSLWIPCSAKFLTVGNNSNDNGVIQIYEVCGTELKLLKEVIFNRIIFNVNYIRI